MWNESTSSDITLNRNNLTSLSWLPGAALSILRTADVGKNQITKLAGTEFDGLDSLYGLRLAGSRISTLTGSAFNKIPSVQILNMAHNQLANLQQDTFVSLRNVQVLWFDDKQLTDINGLFTAQNELRSMNVSANLLQWFVCAFIPKTLERLERLKTIISIRMALTSNSWICLITK